MGAHDFSFTAIDGKPLELQALAGRPILLVNVASYCGFTPQYTDLQALHENYGPRGLVVLGVPCNDFGEQEPRSEGEIAKFCESVYDVTFPMTAKQKVIGPEAHPLYKWLKEEKSGVGPSKIKWNFTKFLVDRHGKPVKRYASTTKPEKLEGDIAKALKS